MMGKDQDVADFLSGLEVDDIPANTKDGPQFDEQSAVDAESQIHASGRVTIQCLNCLESQPVDATLEEVQCLHCEQPMLIRPILANMNQNLEAVRRAEVEEERHQLKRERAEQTMSSISLEDLTLVGWGLVIVVGVVTFGVIYGWITYVGLFETIFAVGAVAGAGFTFIGLMRLLESVGVPVMRKRE